MAKKKSYAKKRKAKNTKFFVMILILTLLFAGFIYYTNSKMDAELRELDQEMTSNKKKMQELDEEITSLEDDYDIRNTDEFKEKIAKERLGMVKKDSEENFDDGESNDENANPESVENDEDNNDNPN
ncbi:septum formation initiator family protein [Anaerococcus sp. Marseille-Q7828]|uniref:FtsB family cell division protein n=1 Tax=Anaerococcus sp. Marseille-Q7828 TaxID=3036300 RepID=UPI0024AD9D38|nr:septum formation initiator family protein [Anaerococcus sp. Marseille-Q7828]